MSWESTLDNLFDISNAVHAAETVTAIIETATGLIEKLSCMPVKPLELLLELMQEVKKAEAEELGPARLKTMTQIEQCVQRLLMIRSECADYSEMFDRFRSEANE